jgi:hypothetical protein
LFELGAGAGEGVVSRRYAEKPTDAVRGHGLPACRRAVEQKRMPGCPESPPPGRFNIASNPPESARLARLGRRMHARDPARNCADTGEEDEALMPGDGDENEGLGETRCGDGADCRAVGGWIRADFTCCLRGGGYRWKDTGAWRRQTKRRLCRADGEPRSEAHARRGPRASLCIRAFRHSAGESRESRAIRRRSNTWWT